MWLSSDSAFSIWAKQAVYLRERKEEIKCPPDALAWKFRGDV
jgi:hypothetical protein